MKKDKRQSKKRVGSAEPHQGQAKEKKVIQQVWLLAEPVCNSEGLELIQVEYQRESAGRILRLYVDKPEGIRLDDCVEISRQLNDILDVHLEDVGPYNLEVSSPGPERPLGRKRDFNQFKGSRVRIKTIQPLNGRKNYKGVLLGFSDDMVSLEIAGQIMAINYANILKAHLIE